MSGRQDTGRAYVPRKPVTLGWTLSDLPCRPGNVLDPFSGTGTTGEVAIKLGRRFIGIELYDQNVKMAVERCRDAARLYRSETDVLFATDRNFAIVTGIPVSGLEIASRRVERLVVSAGTPAIPSDELWPDLLAKLPFSDSNAFGGFAAM